MNRLRTPLLAVALGAALSVSSVASPQWHEREHEGLRGLVERTQADLNSAAGMAHGKSQVDRYQHAEDELSSFDRKLSKGHFDKDRLDKAIENIKSVLEHNTLDPGLRDALRRDLTDLRMARERHDAARY